MTTNITEFETEDRDNEKEKIGDLAKKEHDRISPSDSMTYNLFSFSAYDKDQTPEEKPGTEINSQKYSVPSNVILVSKLNPQFDRVWKVDNAPENSICSTEFIVLKPRNDTPLDFLYGVLVLSLGNVYKK